MEVRLHLAASADADARIGVVAPFRLGSGFASTARSDPSGVVALADGLTMCGRTQVKEDVSTHGDLWIVRTNVDGMLHFLAGSGLACECTAAEWRRIPDHTVRTLAPTASPGMFSGTSARNAEPS